MKLPYDALVFDLGGVIVPHDNRDLHRRLAAGCHGPDALRRITAAVVDPRYHTGALPVAALHEALRRDFGYGRGWDDFLVDWTSHLTIDGAMLDLVERLARSNRVMLFSNTDAEHWRHLVALSGGRLAEIEACLSFEIGLAKPSREAFDAVAARAGIAPARSLFIDDLPENIEGARRAGFQAALFTDQPALERYLGL